MAPPSNLNVLFESSPAPQNSGHSTVPKQLLLQLMEYVINTPKGPPEHHIPALETLTRRTNPQADLISSIMGLIRNSEGVTADSRASSSVDTINTNGISRFTNGLLDITSPGGAAAAVARYSNVLSAPPATNAPRYPPPNVQPPRSYPPTGEPMGLSTAVPAPPATLAPPAPPVPSAYMTYTPALPPPPSIPFYPTYAGTTNNVPYSYPNPMSPQNPRPTTSTAPAAPLNAQGYAQYLARMPHQYYPPFQ